VLNSTHFEVARYYHLGVMSFGQLRSLRPGEIFPPPFFQAGR